MSRKLGGMTLYNINELAPKFEVTPITLRAYCRSGRLKGQKVGNTWWITEESLRAFLEGAGKPGPVEGEKTA